MAYKYDDANQLTEIHSGSLTGPLLNTLTYDNNGNLQSDGTRTYTWDALNQLSQVTKSTTTVVYGYDAEGKRLRKVTGGVTTQWVYEGQDIYSEYGTSWTTPTAVYTGGGGIDDPVIRASVTGATSCGQAQYYYADGLGSVVGLSNNTDSTTQTQRFDAWGNKLTGTIAPSAQYGYTGREPDETGLIYYRARYYDPSLGRFVQRDPMGLQAGINLYSYVSGNPVNFTDPSGLLDIYIGGAGDKNVYYHLVGPTGIVKEYIIDQYQTGLGNPNVAYYGYDETQLITQRINDALTANPAEPINLIGHSLGAQTAAEIAGTTNAPINQLILIDPVGRDTINEFRSNVQTLITVTANPTNSNFTDTIASLGGKGADLPVDTSGSQYSVDANHANFGSMMGAPGPSGLSAWGILSQYGGVFGFAPPSNQSLAIFNPPMQPKR